MSEAIMRGYHFMPTEEELLDILMALLECKSQGKPFPPSPVAEKVLYGEKATPWEIFGDDDAWESADCDGGKKGVKEVVYVLTQLSAMSAKKKARTAGCGTWDGQTGIKEIENRKGEIIGLRKMLSYRVKEGSESQEEKGQWRMHEYALSGVSLEAMALKKIDAGNYVICRITRDYSKVRSPTKNQILGKRKAEVGRESSYYQNKKHIRLMNLVNYNALQVSQSENQVAISDSGTYATEKASEEGEIVISNSGADKGFMDSVNCEAFQEVQSKDQLAASSSWLDDTYAAALQLQEGQTVVSNFGADTTLVAYQENQNVVSSSWLDDTYAAALQLQEGQTVVSNFGADTTLVAYQENQNVVSSSWLDDTHAAALQLQGGQTVVPNSGADATPTAFQESQNVVSSTGAHMETAGTEAIVNLEDEDVDDIEKSWAWFNSIVDLDLDIDEAAEQIINQPVLSPPWQSPPSGISFHDVDIDKDEVAGQIRKHPVPPWQSPTSVLKF